MEYLGSIRSGVTTNLISFRAPAGFGSSGWAVSRSRNGGTLTAYTTPTIAEMSITGHDSIYWLTIDEDTTLAGGHTPTRVNEVMALVIGRTTADEMDPIYGWVEIRVDDVSHQVGKELSIGGSAPSSPIGFA